MKKVFMSVFISIVLLSLSSCTHYYYAPNKLNVPLFDKEKEFSASVAMSVGNEFEAYEFQTAYAIDKNFGIMANGLFADRASGDEYGKGYIIEAGGGYFAPLNKYYVFEIYSGFGFGKVENGYGDQGNGLINSNYSELDFTRFFIQPSLGLTTRYIDVILSSRFAGLYYTDFYYPLNLYESDLKDLRYIEDNPFSMIFEPAATLRLGYKELKFQIQIVYSLNINNPRLQQEEVNLNIGVCLLIGKEYK
jgi:hypothetical protein